MATLYDRIADIPVRHGLIDYVCTIGYSEADAEFHFVSARRADAQKSSPPAKPFDLYLRILREPALRASLLEALVPDQKAQIAALREEGITGLARSHGFWVG